MHIMLFWKFLCCSIASNIFHLESYKISFLKKNYIFTKTIVKYTDKIARNMLRDYHVLEFISETSQT